MDIQTLINIGELSAAFAKSKLGYDRCDFERVWLNADKSIQFTFYMADDFADSSDYPYGFRYIKYDSVSDVPTNVLFADRTRKQRELDFIIKQLKSVTHVSDKMVDAEAKSFVAGIEATAEQYYAAIEDHRIQAQAEAEADNPDITF